jgi:integrase
VLNRVARAVVVQCARAASRLRVHVSGCADRDDAQHLQSARVRAGLPQVRVPDLKHTFGRRLRAAGVSFEDRQDLLGHRSGRITAHYSTAEVAEPAGGGGSCVRGKVPH